MCAHSLPAAALGGIVTESEMEVGRAECKRCGACPEQAKLNTPTYTRALGDACSGSVYLLWLMVVMLASVAVGWEAS